MELAVATHLTGIVLKLCSQPAPTLKHVFYKVLARVGVETQWGQCARSGSLHTSLATCSRLRKEPLHTKLTLDEQHDVRMNVRERLKFLMSESGITDSTRVLNRDETATRLMPAISRGCPKERITVSALDKPFQAS